MIVLAHGVGRVYKLPVPLSLFLLAAAATVVASFLVLGFTRKTHVRGTPRPLLGEGPTKVIRAILQWVAFAGLILTLLSGAIVHARALVFPTLMFWVAFIVGTVFLNVVLKGAWNAADPWRTTEELYRVGEREPREGDPPWWLGPLLVYGLFWFELVSEVGFDSLAVVVVLFGYTAYTLGIRDRYGTNWWWADPFYILFGFGGWVAPLELEERRLTYKGFLRDLVRDESMPLALFASIFVLLASTTLDNIRETTGWTSFKATTNLDAISPKIVDSIALALFAIPFLVAFLIAIRLASRWLGGGGTLDLARRFAWTLTPIPVAYVLAHNAPLLLSATPTLVQELSDPFDRGWNLLHTATLFQDFQASPKLVWFIEIAFVVGGHILGVAAAHAMALRTAPSTKDAIRSQHALTALMALYTIVTLWLLAQAVTAG